MSQTYDTFSLGYGEKEDHFDEDENPTGTAGVVQTREPMDWTTIRLRLRGRRRPTALSMTRLKLRRPT